MQTETMLREKCKWNQSKRDLLVVELNNLSSGERRIRDLFDASSCMDKYNPNMKHPSCYASIVEDDMHRPSSDCYNLHHTIAMIQTEKEKVEEKMYQYNYAGWYMTRQACQHGWVDTIRFMNETSRYVFDSDQRFDEFGNTFLHYAVRASSLELVALLLEITPQSRWWTNRVGNTIVHEAIIVNHQPILSLLVTDIDRLYLEQKNRDTKSCLDMAHEKGIVL